MQWNYLDFLLLTISVIQDFYSLTRSFPNQKRLFKAATLMFWGQKFLYKSTFTRMFTTFLLFTSILVNTSVCGMQLSGVTNSNKTSLQFLFKGIVFLYSC